MKKNIIITCHGWSASNWTAHALNSNTNLLCTHSARNVPAGDKNLHSNENLKKHINSLQKGYSIRQSRSLDTIYDEIESYGKTNVYASVHVIRMRDLPIIHSEFGVSYRDFNIANVVRNPIDLVWSGYGQFKDLFRYDINELHWTSGKVVKQSLEFVNYIGEKYKLFIGDFEVLAFLGACAVLESLKFDFDAYSKVKNIDKLNFIGTYQMEELTTNPDYYSRFFDELDLKQYNSKKYLESVFNTGKINQHKHDNKKITAEERYNEFLPWQKEVFNHFFKLHNLRSSYEEMGYDLSFLNNE